MKKPNKRPTPAFLEYASDMLAKREFRLLSLAERGLLTTMRYECWANKCVPSSPSEMSILLALPEHEITKHLTPNVLSFFQQSGLNLNCPELDKYRENLLAREDAQSKGGSNGGKATQRKNREAQATIEGSLQAPLEAEVKPLNRNEVIRSEKKREELTNKETTEEHKEWLKGYGDGKAMLGKSYEQMSRGY